MFFALVIPIEVVFAKETLGAGDAGYGALLASWGAGMVVGGAAFALLRRIPLRVLLPISVLRDRRRLSAHGVRAQPGWWRAWHRSSAESGTGSSGLPW